MTLLKVTTVVADYTGFCGRVEFTQGTGYADPDKHAAELLYMRANGYTIEELPGTEDPEDSAAAGDAGPQEPSDSEPGEAGAPVKPRRSASAAAWRAYALTQGMTAEEADSLNRDQLAERFADPEETPL